MEKKRNLWIIPTDKPSRLYLTTKEYIFEKEYSSSTDECQNKHIYITNDEEIKEGDWFIEPINKSVLKLKDNADKLINSIFPTCKKIILTTDQDLIKDGVQEIGDEFLEWFVKNPSCEEVITEKVECEMWQLIGCNKDDVGCCGKPFEGYKIKEPKQETLEEVARVSFNLGYDKGTKWQQERMYSEEDLISLLEFNYKKETNQLGTLRKDYSQKIVREWFEQFKKK